MTQQGHIDDVLLDFLYGELPERQARDVEQHLASCARCADEVSRARGVRAAFGRLPQLEPSAQTTATILRRARELAPQPRRWSFVALLLRPSIAGAFAFVLVIGIGLYLARHANDGSPTAEQPSVDRFARVEPPPAAAAPAAAPETQTPPPPALAPAPT